MSHITFYYWHWHKIQSHQFGNPLFGTLARPFNFRQWLRVCAVKIGAWDFCNLVSTCQVLGHACHIWYSLGLKSLTHNHSTRAGQWGSVVSWWACSTGSEKAVRVSRSIGIFFKMDLKYICKLWSLVKTHDLLICDIIKMMPYNGYSQMLLFFA